MAVSPEQCDIFLLYSLRTAEITLPCLIHGTSLIYQLNVAGTCQKLKLFLRCFNTPAIAWPLRSSLSVRRRLFSDWAFSCRITLHELCCAELLFFARRLLSAKRKAIDSLNSVVRTFSAGGNSRRMTFSHTLGDAYSVSISLVHEGLTARKGVLSVCFGK